MIKIIFTLTAVVFLSTSISFIASAQNPYGVEHELREIKNELRHQRHHQNPYPKNNGINNELWKQNQRDRRSNRFSVSDDLLRLPLEIHKANLARQQLELQRQQLEIQRQQLEYYQRLNQNQPAVQNTEKEKSNQTIVEETLETANSQTQVKQRPRSDRGYSWTDEKGIRHFTR